MHETSYHYSRLYDEAVHTYSLLIKNKQHPHSGRLRVNLGNIYFEQERYQLSIRMRVNLERFLTYSLVGIAWHWTRFLAAGNEQDST